MTEEEMRRFENDQHWSSYLLFAVGIYSILVLALIGMVTVIRWLI